MAGLLNVLNLISMLLSLVPEGTQLYADLQAQKAQAEQWKAEGHLPTDAEWQSLDALVEDREAKIAALTRAK